MSSTLDTLPVPIVQAPMAGGPSTSRLAAAVCEAGGFGFVAAGYRTPDGMREDIRALRDLTARPFGVNLFMPSPDRADEESIERYARALGDQARRAGASLGTARFDDDAFQEKLEILLSDPVPVVSFTFGCPSSEVVQALIDAGTEVWVTVTTPEEAAQAESAGASALVVQGSEAGGHRGSFSDRFDLPDYSILALLQLIGAQAGLPLVAAGGIATGRGVAAVVSAGAAAAQIGPALMRSREAATSRIHREAPASSRPTGTTRVFTGRLARGIVNRLMREKESDAIIAYPEVHFLTAPLRAHGREVGDADVINLWAGQTHQLAQERPAGEIVRSLHAEAIEAVHRARERLSAVESADGRR